MNAEELKGIGERIRIARNELDMTQAELAEALNVSPPYISNIEQGKQAMGIKILRDLCDVLDVSADWILRNRSSESRAMTNEEIATLLDDCSPSERDALLSLFKNMRDALRIKSKE